MDGKFDTSKLDKKGGSTSATGDHAGRGVTQRARAASQDPAAQASSSSSSTSVPTSYWQYLNRPTPTHERVQLYENQRLQQTRARSQSSSASYASGKFVGYVDPADQLSAYNKFVTNKPYA